MNADRAKPLNAFLRKAVIVGVESTVQLHIDRGDDLNARDTKGMTALMLAAARNNPSVCRLLLNAGANHSLLDQSGKTALDIAIDAGSSSVVAILNAVVASDLAVRDAELVDAPSLANEANSLRDGDFDISGWEAEDEPTPPEVNPTVAEAASAIQIGITAHRPIDSSVDWNDIEVLLPNTGASFPGADNAKRLSRTRHRSSSRNPKAHWQSRTLRSYQREFRRVQLLTTEEEIRLAKNMEAAVDAALDALVSWPEGIARTLAAGREAISGSRKLSSIWDGGEADLEAP